MSKSLPHCHLSGEEITRIRTALKMARNCLNQQPGELMKKETQAEIYHALQIFNNKEKRHHEH